MFGINTNQRIIFQCWLLFLVLSICERASAPLSYYPIVLYKNYKTSPLLSGNILCWSFYTGGIKALTLTFLYLHKH